MKDLKANGAVQLEENALEKGVRERTIAPSDAAVRLIRKYLKSKT